MSLKNGDKSPDPRVLTAQYLDDSKRYDELRNEAHRFHYQAGRQLFARYRFYILGLIVAGIAFAILNRDLSTPLLNKIPEVTSVRLALGIWAVGFAFGLYSIQTTIAAHFVEARVEASVYAHMARFSGLASRQNQRIASGLAPDPEIERQIQDAQDERDKTAKEVEEKQRKLIAREFWQSSVCAACFFFGSSIFAIPLFS